ncbi:hypothetical protein KVT40_001425 [Elsinoe batatas]|uniref:O-methyltransferase C-terminal domain-containing protein n=1 Tax=Elsinoe batatas TaxID=2601811 RepID=A0A8K0PHA3_9PEZI|nr:hypothetical protein KVT40_001425 [Elsinoe batatas]
MEDSKKHLAAVIETVQILEQRLHSMPHHAENEAEASDVRALSLACGTLQFQVQLLGLSVMAPEAAVPSFFETQFTTMIAIKIAMDSNLITLLENAGTDGITLDEAQRVLESTFPGYGSNVLPRLGDIGIISLGKGGRISRTTLSSSMMKEKPAFSRLRIFHEHVIPVWSSPMPTFSVASRSPFQAYHDTDLDFFEYLKKSRTEDVVHFSRAMESFSSGHAISEGSILANFPWKDFTTVLDLGGSNGDFAKTIMKIPSASKCRFIIQDREEAIPTTRYSERMTFEPRNFFEADWSNPDALVIVRHVLHDWEDAKARMILKAIAEPMKPTEIFLIVEAVLDSLPTDSRIEAENTCLVTYTLLRGRERTKAEWEDLIRSANANLTISSIDHIEGTTDCLIVVRKT